MRTNRLPLLLVPSLLLSCGSGFAAEVPANVFDALQWRLIGPFRAGRVISVTGVPGDPATFYFGAVGGGMWKTTGAGSVWFPIFDQQHIASIGAVAIAPSNPQVLYVGSGEADMRSDIGYGDGVYKSTDAGKTWRNVGLRDSRQIARILVDPKNPDVVFVAATGHGYGPNAERGVYRSTDGGGTWRKVLDKGPEIGAVDLAFDPANSRHVYATVWHGQRPPWSVYGPLEGSGGLYKSTDGGDTWKQLSGHGLPEGEWKRSGVATGPGQVVYALIDAAAGAGLYRSSNGGDNWTKVSSDPRITSRGWYFGGITVDPRDPDMVYIPNVALYRSTDGGRNFTVLKGAPGGDDYHVLWIDPTEPRRMILGSDQGTNISVDRGATWSSWYNQPTAQIYHVTTDNRFPYWVYGSQQDSGTAAVASRTDHGEIDSRDWASVGGAESGRIEIDTKDPNILYVGNTTGSLARFDRRNAQAQNITPGNGRGSGIGGDISTSKYRFPWTAAMATSPLEPGALYYGSQVVLKTVDGGLTWREISPDLTGDKRADKTKPATVPVTPLNAAELGYGVIWSIAPSPLTAAVIWTGSDSGLVHVTRDGGKSWQNVTPKEIEPFSNVTHVEASRFDAGTAWAAVDRHQRDDIRPYLYRTRDFGKTWVSVTSGLGETAFLNAVREDPRRKGLLYAATELGVAVSFDAGDHWQPLQLNLPAVSVRDLVIHEDDLVIATHGRGFWILDDAAPLREISEKTAGEDTVLFRPAKALRLNPEVFSGTPFPVEEPKGKNPPSGAIIDYYLKSMPGEVTLEILSGTQVIRRFSTKDPAPAGGGRGGAPVIADAWIEPPQRLTARMGMNRFVWDLRYGLPASAGEGPHVVAGTYTVRLTADGKSYTQPLKVAMDPRSVATPAELTKQLQFGLSVMRAMEKAAAAGMEASALRTRVAGDAALSAELNAIAGGGGGGRGRGGRGGGAGAPTLASVNGELAGALAISESADRMPPATAYAAFEAANTTLNGLLEKWRALKAKAEAAR